MSKLQIFSKSIIHDGKQDEYKAVARQLFEHVRDKEKGTLCLQYDWYLSPDGRTCSVVEVFPSSEACMQHMGNVGHLLGQLMALCTIEQLDVYGRVSEELRHATASMKPTIHAPFLEL
jgi:quinol monooxygenase YgiN